MAEDDPDKVVYLSWREDGRGRATPYAIELTRRCAEQRLVAVLRRALDAATDELYRRCGRDGEENDCLQGMRMVRLQRHDLEEVMRAGLEFRFGEVAGAASVPHDPEPMEDGAVPPEEPERVQRLKEAVADSEVAVGEAFAALLPRISGERHPLAAEGLIDLFFRASRRVPADAWVRGVLYRHWLDELERALPGLHAEALQLLRGERTSLDEGVETPDEPRDAERWHSERAIRSRERVEEARQRVHQEVERCLEGRDPPEVVRRLLEDAWSRVLFLDYLRWGPESDEWVRHCAIMERLLWSVEADRDPEESRRLIMEIPLLLHELGEGLGEVLYDPFEMNKLLRALEAEHLRCLKAIEPDVGERPEGLQETLSANERESHLKRLSGLPEGTWFDLETHAGHRIRVRLAGVDDDGNLLFANRAGFKVLERSREELADALLERRAEILDDHRLFNSALSSVVRRLRERRVGHVE